MNKEHAQKHPGEFDLQARIASYELAAKMQSSATEALDITKETKATHRLYGIDDAATKDYGTRCLIARRLIERGVRFAQVFTRYQFWDHHGNIRTSLPRSCKKVDRPSAALITDRQGMGTWLWVILAASALIALGFGVARWRARGAAGSSS